MYLTYFRMENKNNELHDLVEQRNRDIAAIKEFHQKGSLLLFQVKYHTHKSSRIRNIFV